VILVAVAESSSQLDSIPSETATMTRAWNSEETNLETGDDIIFCFSLNLIDMYWTIIVRGN